MDIRNIKEVDFLDCVNIVKKSWPEFKERESIYHLFSKYFSDTSFVIEQNSQVVSFLLGFLSQVDSSTAYIHLTSTNPQYQRRWYPSALYQHFFKIVHTKCRTKVCLIVNPDNKSSLEFHKKLGFYVANKGPIIKLLDNVEAVKDYNGPGNHMVMFSKTWQKMVDENKKKMVDESKTKFIISNISVIIANKEQCDKLYDMLEEGIIEDDSNFEYD